MKVIVAHYSPDWDAITSVWLIKKYLSGWQSALVKYVPAGERLPGFAKVEGDDPIQVRGTDTVIHVDTGLGPLDHHQTSDRGVCAASRTWDYVQKELKNAGDSLSDEHREAVSRIVRIVVDIDHFGEVFWKEPQADYHEFSLNGVLEGLKLEKPDQDDAYMGFGIQCLNALRVTFENRIWAEKEIKEKAITFKTKFGTGVGFDTMNDTVIKLSQKLGYVLVVRKDPRKGYVRIKTLPDHDGYVGIDLTQAYESFKKIDPDATWYLHVSKKMLLNGSTKSSSMKPTKLSVHDIIKVLENIYE
jgi:hypothetical protein